MIHEVFAYLCVRDAAAAIDFYRRAFGVEEDFRLVEPGTGRVGHAELRFGPATIMLSDEYPEIGILAPQPPAGAGMRIHLHVDDADATIARFVAAGGTLVSPAEDAFYGERSGRVLDPFGHVWLIGHDIETVEPAEMQRRWDAMVNSPASAP